MLLPLVSLCFLTIPQSWTAAALPSLVPKAFNLADHTPVQQWNSSHGNNGKPVKLSYGATWSFVLNGYNVDRLDINFEVANFTDEVSGFSSTFQCSALFISFRFDEGHVVFNSRRDGDWDFEQRHNNPIHKWEKFDLVIRLARTGYEICIDGYWHDFSSHRLPYWQVSAVTTYAEGEYYAEMQYSQPKPVKKSVKKQAKKPVKQLVKQADYTDYDTEGKVAKLEATIAQQQRTLGKCLESLSKVPQCPPKQQEIGGKAVKVEAADYDYMPLDYQYDSVNATDATAKVTQKHATVHDYPNYGAQATQETIAFLDYPDNGAKVTQKPATVHDYPNYGAPVTKKTTTVHDYMDYGAQAPHKTISPQDYQDYGPVGKTAGGRWLFGQWIPNGPSQSSVHTGYPEDHSGSAVAATVGEPRVGGYIGYGPVVPSGDATTEKTNA